MDDQVDILAAVIDATVGDDCPTLWSAPRWSGCTRVYMRYPRARKSRILVRTPYDGNQRMTVMIHEGCESALVHRRRGAELIRENFGTELPAALKTRSVNHFQHH